MIVFVTFIVGVAAAAFVGAYYGVRISAEVASKLKV